LRRFRIGDSVRHKGVETFARRSLFETVSLPTIRAEVDSARDRYRVSPTGTLWAGDLVRKPGMIGYPFTGPTSNTSPDLRVAVAVAVAVCGLCTAFARVPKRIRHPLRRALVRRRRVEFASWDARSFALSCRGESWVRGRGHSPMLPTMPASTDESRRF